MEWCPERFANVTDFNDVTWLWYKQNKERKKWKSVWENVEKVRCNEIVSCLPRGEHKKFQQERSESRKSPELWNFLISPRGCDNGFQPCTRWMTVFIYETNTCHQTPSFSQLKRVVRKVLGEQELRKWKLSRLICLIYNKTLNSPVSSTKIWFHRNEPEKWQRVSVEGPSGVH